MGKKSRLKRERREEPGLSALLRSLQHRRNAPRKQVPFSQLSDPLELIFSKYRAEDVCLAVAVSQLWLPNISSQVKHSLAWSVLASMPPERFSGENDLNSFAAFADFCGALYQAFPSFPMLEDYVPESDWGDIRLMSSGVARRIFYGACVERIPDFIEAFILGTSDIPAALSDMDAVLRLQDHVISQIDRSLIRDANEITSGHVEVPSQSFWEACGPAIRSAAQTTRAVDSLSPQLIVKLGSARRPDTQDEFGNAVMAGEATPYILLDADGTMFPVCLRDAPSAILEYWSARRVTRTPGTSAVTQTVSRFLAERMPERTLLAGPAKFTTPSRQLGHDFAAVMLIDSVLDFILVLRPDNVADIEKIEQFILHTFREGTEWGMARRNGSIVGIPKRNGSSPGFDDVRITVVIDGYSTALSSVARPSTEARLIWLPDFVTLFDSLREPEELNAFWAYVDANEGMIGPMSRSIPELYASFRDTHGVLVEGALTPTLMILDPHWASNWRHSQLLEYWNNAPQAFPDDCRASWEFGPPDGEIYTLTSRIRRVHSKGAAVAHCMVYFVCEDSLADSDILNRKLLLMLAHCAADATVQRKHVLETEALFQRPRITIRLLPDPQTLGSGSGASEDAASQTLMSEWTLTSLDENGSVAIQVRVNLARVQSELDSPIDARFEVECVREWISGVSPLLGLSVQDETREALDATASRGIRFRLTTVAREVDVPETGFALRPTSEQYKLARRELAKLIQRVGVKPGRYELVAGQRIVSSARDEYRSLVHAHIAEFNSDSLLEFAISRYDELTTLHRNEVARHHQSLTHEVDYDREGSLSEASEEFLRMARNYRYLIEACLSADASGTQTAQTDSTGSLLGEIDWLLVLYEASDVLYNEVEVGGIEITDDFVPDVFYSDDGATRKETFARERASIQLGHNVSAVDEVQADDVVPDWLTKIDAAFDKDVGFPFSQLMQVLYVLTRWVSFGGSKDFTFGYKASPDQLVQILISRIDSFSSESAKKIISFLTLEREQVRRLIGRDVPESDVPVWEHNKRGARLNIRPLIKLSDGNISWGASLAERASQVWMQSLRNGFLPADFEWSTVKIAIRAIKEGIEKGLERKAAEIFERSARFVKKGIDFRRTFSKERFDDVGDFDVLAYWPETNTWVTVECKYNQPAYCIKDLRRLRERIFELPPGKHQLAKIEGRRNFLTPRIEQIRSLLSWPEPSEGVAPNIIELYVGKDLYWWMRFPPYDVPTEFLQIDMLDGWLSDRMHRFLGSSSPGS